LEKLLSVVRQYQQFVREFFNLIDTSLNASQIAVMQYLIDVGEISDVLTPELCAMKCWMSCHKNSVNTGYQEENIRALAMYELPEDIFSFIALKNDVNKDNSHQNLHTSKEQNKTFDKDDVVYVPSVIYSDVEATKDSLTKARHTFLQMWPQLTFIRALGYHYASQMRRKTKTPKNGAKNSPVFRFCIQTRYATN